MTIVKAKHVTLVGEHVMLRSAQHDPDARLVPDAGAMRPTEVAPRDSASERERDALLARIAELENELAEYRSGVEQQLGAAFKRGEEAARTEQIRSEAERVTALRDGVARAVRILSDSLKSLDSLAAEIARVALERVLGDTSRYADLVTSTVRHRVGMLATGTALEIRVAEADFPDASALDRLQAAIPAMPPVKLLSDPALTEGACIVSLPLGKLDASIPRQHERIAAVLDEVSADD
ncbi:FliH/SctL family protein [Burkholderia ambifaria]|uniref:FliH/SctL family protein n=1 Tax=Burkholderia ambifaria TaxID=152480 RepID=UPI00158C66C6|nr:FliH/SctL family protein [Burkholderia ambifaria]